MEKPATTQNDLNRRARLRVMLLRRRRFWRSVLYFSIGTTVMVLLVLANRDAQQYREITREGHALAEALQREARARASLPLLLPNLPPPHENVHERYYFNLYYATQLRWTQPVGVCCSRKAWHFFLRSDGRSVILYDGERFFPRWMNEREFRLAAERLGFSPIPGT